MITTKDKLKNFKSELYQYQFCQKKVEEYTLELEAISVKLYEVSSPQIKQVILENNRNPKSTNILELMEQEERLVKERNVWAKRVSDVDNALNKLSNKERELLRIICIEGKGYHPSVALKEGYSIPQLKRNVNRIIKSIVE